mgnify:CR=1 FL=1
MKPLHTAIFALSLLVASSTAPTTALAFDDDLDDLGDDLLDAPKGGVKTKAPADPEAEGDFDFGDDPDWDAGPAPVQDDIGGFDEDPPEDGGAPEDDFDFGDDPPDDFIQAPPPPRAGSGDPLDDDPPADLGPAGAAAPVLGLGVATKGKSPLADNYPAAIVGKDLDAVVVELPILVASKPTDVAADYWLVTEIHVGDRKVGESRHFVSRQSVADMGPTLVWLKSVVPVLERTGKVELRVSQTPDGGEATQLFTKTVDYAL